MHLAMGELAVITVREVHGGEAAAPIGLLPPRARFHWLTAKRSSIIQTSPVHMGRCGDLPATLEHLMDRMVRPPKATAPR